LNARTALFGLCCLLSACYYSDGPDTPDTDTSSSDTDDTASGPTTHDLDVSVKIDGAPASFIPLHQPGAEGQWLTNADGVARISLDLTVTGGEIWVVASHPEARIWGQSVDPATDAAITIDLVRYEADNVDYEFREPGSPDNRETTSQCAHCHVTMSGEWAQSPHRTSASNPVVQDLYAGSAHAFTGRTACEAEGGRWWIGLVPGTTDTQPRCYLGPGALPDLNTDCGDTAPCDQLATETGGCADCHAPGINGDLGGRDLLEATGIEFSEGVHCDVCHRVDTVDLNAPPGVAGRLQLTRPSEPAVTPGTGDYLPLTFGPFGDIPTTVMGSVQRDHFHEATLCAGCHEQQQAVLVPDATLDSTRWPSGTLPIHTTYSEWQASPMHDVQPCQGCHMPPNPLVGNASDLYSFFDLTPGYTAGWERPPGAVREHSWVGPRTPSSGMLQLAAALFVEQEMDGNTLTVHVTTKNVGPGHAIPTGEPMRSLLLSVQAACGTTGLSATGGDVVPEFGGYLDRKDTTEDWTVWPGAAIGDHIQVIRTTGDYHDYQGYGPFGDGRFSATDKGMPVQEFVASARVADVTGDVVTLDGELPVGDIAYRVGSTRLPDDGDFLSPQAGTPGFAFARVLAGATGETMVPHFLATDVVSDNRLLPQHQWTSTHEFLATCDTPVVTARLFHRAYPPGLDAQRQWGATETLMVEVSQ